MICKYPDNYQQYCNKVLCHGINLMFNPVAYLINTVVKEKQHIPKFVEQVNNDISLLEKYTSQALNILKDCMPPRKQVQLKKLERKLFSTLFSRIVTGYRTLVGILLEDDIFDFKEKFTTLPHPKVVKTTSPLETTHHDEDKSTSINSMKFSKPRVKIENPYPDEDISFVDTLRRIALHCDKKQSFNVENSIIEENRLKARKKYFIRGLKKSTDKLEEEVSVSSFLETRTEFCFLPVRIDDQTYKFLIDTGASRSLILNALVPNSNLASTSVGS